jgi:hypothetical protein
VLQCVQRMRELTEKVGLAELEQAVGGGR